jgi:hypothetical protein
MVEVMNVDKRKRSVSKLESERSNIAMQLEENGLAEVEAAPLLEQHEALDWLIARTPARDLTELKIKLDRLSALIYPLNEPMPFDCIEHTLIKHIKRNIQSLIQNYPPNITSP